jgi:hypothetical protein
LARFRTENEEFGAGRHPGLRARGRNDHRRGRVRDHEGQALVGVGGIEGQHRPARLQDGEHGDGHLERPLDAHPDRHVGAHTRAGQPAGETVRSIVEVGVGQRPFLVHHGQSTRRASRLLLHELMQATLVGRRWRGAAPCQQPALLLLGKERQFG